MSTPGSLRDRWRAVPRIARLGTIAASLVAALILSLALLGGDVLRGPLERMASSRLGREVRIEGPLDVRLLRSAPVLEARKLRFAQPAWFGRGTMATVERLYASIELVPLLRGRVVFRELQIDRPVLTLQRRADRRANWQLRRNPPPATRGARLPVLRDFRLRDGNLHIEDAVRELSFDGAVAADEQARNGVPQTFRLVGNGKLNGESFVLQLSGSPLVNIRPEQPYAFTARIAAGATRAALEGSLVRPFDLGHLQMRVDAIGGNLADLYYLTGLPLPRTAAYRLQMHLRRTDNEFTVRDINGKVGNSDLRGDATLRLRAERPLLTAKLVSHSLRLRDLGIAFGASPAAGAAQEATTTGEPLEPLLPDHDFDFERLQRLDANVEFQSENVQTARVPLQKVAIRMRLEDGVMTLDPVVFTMPRGRLTGNVDLDTRRDVPEAAFDLRITGVQLQQFKPKQAAQGPLAGELTARAKLTGHGRSVHDIAASADGALAAVVPRGEVREAVAELTGINVLRGLGLLLSKSEQTANIRCGVAEFQVSDGVAHAQRIVFDTEHVLVTGKGTIELQDESLDLELTGKPKKLRLIRLRSPVTVTGRLSKPAFGIEAEEVALQGGIAALVGALLTPLAASLAFIDPGLAKNADCAALLAEARSGEAPVPAAGAHARR